MKNILLLPLVAASFLALPACTTVDERPSVQSTTTTTEETVVREPLVAPRTTETRTIRTY